MISGNRSIGRLVGFRDDTITSRIHIRLTRRHDLRWYLYWLEQFDTI